MGNAAAAAFAAPLGSWVGGMIGWRGVFWALVPLAAVILVWQWIRLPSMPPRERVPAARVLALWRRPHVASAMARVMPTFGGAFAPRQGHRRPDQCEGAAGRRRAAGEPAQTFKPRPAIHEQGR
jgi:MFS family permease